VDGTSPALEAWARLRETCLLSQGDRLVVRARPGSRRLAPAWPASQVLAAAADLAELTGDLAEVEALVRGLRPYAAGDGFAPLPGRRRRYFDDNAWIGLVFAQLYEQTRDDRWRRRARRVWRFVREGEDADGGIRWVEGRCARHTCAAAPAAQLALRLRRADAGPATQAFGEEVLGWLDRTLRLPDGLYADHEDRRGRVDRTLWTYNQGAALGAHVQLHLVTGDPAPLEAALVTARASLRRFGRERTWRHPPAFNAIWFRNLMALDALAPVPGLERALGAYLDRARRTGRDPSTGLFTAGGIGSYDGDPALDHAGVVQLLALRAWPRALRGGIA
jgi:Glycosyl hydrolase family 76